MKKGITTHCKEELKLQESLSIELPTENGEIRFARRKAQSNQTDSVKVGLILLDTGSETTLANQLSIQGPKQNLTVQAVEEVRTTVKSH